MMLPPPAPLAWVSGGDIMRECPAEGPVRVPITEAARLLEFYKAEAARYARPAPGCAAYLARWIAELTAAIQARAEWFGCARQVAA